MRVLGFGALTVVLLCGAALAEPAAPAPTPPALPTQVAATIDAAQTGAPVSKYEYGMFIEHIGKLIYRTLWSQMLDNRKFGLAVLPAGESAAPKPVENGPPRFAAHNWHALGSDAAVTMDAADPYVGAQSARVKVEASPRGIEQGALALVKGKGYVGHVVLRGSPTARVRVTLIWGEGAAGRQSIAIPKLAAAWQSYPLRFTAGADVNDARFEITGTGTGTFAVGVASLMPADNVQGWRPDTIALLRSLHPGMWRLPGGNFLSDHDWHDAIGNRDTRAPSYDYAWNAMQSNDVGLDEFMTLCKLLGTEPYITVNAGFGGPHSAAEEVEYLNGPVTSMWGAVRAKNGHGAPYGVRYWDIGNEPYGAWQLGHTTLDDYVLKHNKFAHAMRKVDPSIVLLASGAMPDQLKAPGVVHENSSLQSIMPKFGTDLDWTGGLLAKSWGNFDGLTEHWYDKAEQRPNAPPDYELLEFARQPSNQVRMKADEWAIYQKRFPAMKTKGIFLSIDEYAYIGAPPDLKSALAYSMILQEMLRHTDFLKMAALTMGVSTLDITPTASALNSTGEVYKLYGEHFGAGEIPLAVTGNSPQPAPRYPVGLDHPSVRAGSATYPLDVIAGLSPDRRTLTIAVVNPTYEARPLTVTLDGVTVSGQGTLWRLTGASVRAANKVGAPPGVTIQKSAVAPFAKTLVVAPISTSIYSFNVAAP